MSIADQFKNIEIESEIFDRPSMILVYGGSYSGKTHMIENLILRHHKKFKKIIVCGAKNALLTHESTSQKAEFYENDESPIYNPFIQNENTDNDCRQTLLILDDLMAEVTTSQLASKCFSKGRHLNLSVVIILQSFYPQGSGKSVVPMLKNNSNLQFFFRLRNRSEMKLISKKLEHTKKGQDFLMLWLRERYIGRDLGTSVCLMTIQMPNIEIILYMKILYPMKQFF